MKWLKFSLLLIFMTFIVSGIANSYLITEYFTKIKEQNVLGNVEQNIESTVKRFALKNNQDPIEPKIDPIWKLIPGYNGLLINEDLTIKYAKNANVKDSSNLAYIYEEMVPKKDLDDFKSYPIYRGNPKKPMVSLMINVAWGTEYLDSILTTLRLKEVRATFFLDGSWVKKNPEMTRRIANEGHEIGNHAYTHPQMSRLTSEKINEEIKKTEEIIYQITKQKSSFFAPPSGDYDQRVVTIAESFQLKTILWTVDTIDWQKPSPETIIKRIIPKVNNGYLVLMHPTESTAKALPQLIQEIEAKGLKIDTVKETLSSKRNLPVEPLPEF